MGGRCLWQPRYSTLLNILDGGLERAPCISRITYSEVFLVSCKLQHRGVDVPKVSGYTGDLGPIVWEQASETMCGRAYETYTDEDFTFAT
jgi:hypothetical protein